MSYLFILQCHKWSDTLGGKLADIDKQSKWNLHQDWQHGKQYEEHHMQEVDSLNLLFPSRVYKLY